MATFEVKRELHVPADVIWKTLRDFGSVADWMPGVQSCKVQGEGVGAIRDVTLGGNTVRERLESLDDVKRSFSYSLLGDPAPIKDYLATVRVTEIGPGTCRVVWGARFEPPQGVPAEAITGGIAKTYGGALDALESRLR